MEHRPRLQVEDQAPQEAWAITLDYGDAEEEEYEEESGSASFGSLMGMSMGKPRKRPVLEIDPEELAKANRLFELSGAKILDNSEERPAPVYGKIVLDPFDGSKTDFDAEDEEAFEEELAAGTIEPDAEELRTETAARLDAMLGLGAESVTAEYDEESDASLPPLISTSAKAGKKPLFVHTDDEGAGSDADSGLPFYEEVAHSPEWNEPEAADVPSPFGEREEFLESFEEPHHEEPASPVNIWDPPEEEFVEPQWPHQPAWPDLYPDEEEDSEANRAEPVPEPAGFADAEPAEPPVEDGPVRDPSPVSSVVLSVEEFEEEDSGFGNWPNVDGSAPDERMVLARMERPASHSSVRARLVRDTEPSKSLWHYFRAATVSFWRLLSGRR